MSRSAHEHEWVHVGGSASSVIRCACGANLWAVQKVLDDAAEDARSAAGESYYTGCRICSESEEVELWLCAAPAQLVGELHALHPGMYVIHCDAPRPQCVLDELRDSFDWQAWNAERVVVVSVGPGQDGYLQVGVLDDVEGAQKQLDAIYGQNVVRVSKGVQAIPC
jgi:hypothetical protein